MVLRSIGGERVAKFYHFFDFVAACGFGFISPNISVSLPFYLCPESRLISCFHQTQHKKEELTSAHRGFFDASMVRLCQSEWALIRFGKIVLVPTCYQRSTSATHFHSRDCNIIILFLHESSKNTITCPLRFNQRQNDVNS